MLERDEAVRTPSTTANAPLLRVSGVRKSFRVPSSTSEHGRLWALDGVDLTINPGETVGLVGETGCGKSTLARVVLTLETPDEGQIRFDDVDLLSLRRKQRREWQKRVQMVFQDPYSSLNPRMSIRDIISEPWRQYRSIAPRDRDGRVAELLALVGLRASDARRYPQELSGGQRQRVGVARALALEPDILVCDEPLSSLDLSVQAQVLNLFADLQDKIGISYLFISHDLSVVRYVCDRIFVMYLGRIVESGPTDEVFNSPRHPYTAALLSSVPRLDAVRGEATRRIVLEGDPPSPVDVPSGCRFRTRCWRAQDKCAEISPVLETDVDNPDHFAACHFPIEPDPASFTE